MIDNETAARPPLSFWVVGALSLLWNGFGAYDYLMTRMRNEAYLGQSGDAKAMLAWIDGLPLWLQLCWGLGVWGAVAGSVLLLARSRFAVPAFLASLLGAVGSLAYQVTSSNMPAGLDGPGRLIMPIVIVAVAAFLWQFARREAENGTLR